jgi:hypothetical protein
MNKDDHFRSEGGADVSTVKMVGTYDVSCRDQEHRDHRVLDDLVRRLFLVIEHEQTYHEKREIYA